MALILLEMIKLFFAVAIIITTLKVLRPALRHLSTPLPLLKDPQTSWKPQTMATEIEIPQAQAETITKFHILDNARQSPMKTTLVLKQWLHN